MPKWSDNEIKSHALRVWANYIETGDPAMSAEMARKAGRKSEINDLPSEKAELVARMRQLSIDVLQSPVQEGQATVRLRE